LKLLKSVGFDDNFLKSNEDVINNGIEELIEIINKKNNFEKK
jgi:uncharacterized membrane protein